MSNTGRRTNARVRKDPWSAHEALDRAHVTGEIFSDHVAGHPFVRAWPELNALAAEIEEKLADLYQEIGQRIPE
jgi:hypothetical protein